MTSDEEQEEDDDASEGRTSFLETEYSHAYSSDAVAEELACALKIRLTELQLWQQGGRSGKPGFVSFWWCCDGARSSGCPETVRAAPTALPPAHQTGSLNLSTLTQSLKWDVLDIELTERA